MGTSTNDYIGPRAFVSVAGVAGNAHTLAASVLATSGCKVQLQFVYRLAGAAVNVINGSLVTATGAEQRINLSGTAAGTYDQIEVQVRHCAMPVAGPSFLYTDAVQFEAGASASLYSNQLATVSGTGVVTFLTAPVNSSVLTWTGAFYRRCIFSGETFDATKFMTNFWEAKKVDIESVLYA
jgi:hypothetical protein